MNHLHASKMILLAAAVLVLLCSSRQQRLAQKSFVRAVLIEENAAGCSVGLLYQDVAASADASEAGEQLRIVTGQGACLPEAFDAAERRLPEYADYKLCDYTILCGAWNGGILRQYQELLLSQSVQGRLSASLYACGETVDTLADFAEKQDDFTAEWMDALVRQKALCPRLYSVSQPAAVLPLLTVEKQMPGRWCDGAVLLCAETGAQALDENAAQMLWLLLGRKGQRKFLLDGAQVVLNDGRIERTAQTEGVCVQIWATLNGGGQSLDGTAARLENLAQQTLAACGEAGRYLLGADAVSAMAGKPAQAAAVRVEIRLTQ